MDNEQDRKKIENIVSEPLARHRLFLNGKIRAAKDEQNPQPFTLDELRQFMATVPATDPAYAAEVQNVLQAVATGVAPTTPSFRTPDTQIIWGAALAYLSLNPAQMQAWQPPLAEGAAVGDSPLWQQITKTRTAYQELLSHAHHVEEALRDKDTRYSWSKPGTGFAFDRKNNHINIDLMQSMIVGFEHARADVYREIGHSLLSVTYPKLMQQLYNDMRPLLIKSRKAQEKKGPQLTPEEYKKLRMLSAEWELRHMMFSSAEENVASKFVSNMGLQMLQDYGVSLNNTAVTFRGIGLNRIPPAGSISDELRRYMNLCNAVQLSFFQNNDLFGNTDAEWNKVGIDPALVRKTATLATRPAGQKEDADGINHPDFVRLRELCGGDKGLENLQPKAHERLYGWRNLQGRIKNADLARKAIIEEIWREYGEDLIQQVLKQASDQIDEQLKDAQQNPQNQPGQDGQEGQEGQEGQDGQEGQQQGQQGSKPGQGQGSGQGGGKPQKGQQGKQPKQRGKPQGKQEQADGAKGDQDQQQGQNGEEQEDQQQGQDGQQQKQEGAEGQLGTDKENTVPVEGAGDMPAPEMPTETPADEVDPNGTDPGAEGDGKDGQDGEDGQDGQTAEEMEQEMEEGEPGEAGEEGEDADDASEADQDGEDGQDGQAQGGKRIKSKRPGKKAGKGGKGTPLSELAQRDWTDYNRRVAELSGPINRVRKLFKGVQERQLQRKSTMSPTLDILPENGEVKDRFNAEAHRNLTIKKQTGSVEEGDLKRFHKDAVKMVPTEIDIVIMIDGSGSMMGDALNMALQAGAIMFEAASGKDMNMNVYVGMWGSDDPPIIVQPGADRAKIGKAMQAARRGLSSGTDFAPAVKKVAETIGQQRGKSGTLSGFTHVLILSDGDIFDQGPSKENIKTMFAYSDKITFDTAIMGSSGSSMEKMAKSMKAHKPQHEVGVVRGTDPNEMPMAIVGLLLDKVRKCGSFTAIPNNKKRRAMKKAHNKMGK